MPRRDPLDLFLDGCARVRATGAGTAETSFYPAISDTLNAVGDQLSPKVLCLHHPSGGKAGIPDFGLFERTAFRKGEAPEWRGGVSPERGGVEVKGAGHDIAKLLASDQVRQRYLPEHGLVLATNLWQWRLLDAAGLRESFDLAEDEAGFWQVAHGSRPEALRKRFADFLRRCLLWRAPLARPKDVAFFLASYARDAMALMEERASLPALATLRGALERSLGIAFDARDGERLFRSTLVQTLFYGLFSAWAAHDHRRPFDWRAADYDLHLPVVRLLYNQVRAPQALRPLGFEPLLDAATATLARVDRDAFFRAFDAAHAVQYFYEPFLEFFDPDLRKQLGVWYTPPEIVDYMVERVDRVLREELGRADGLADPDVWVLDPCCGTGSYVVQVLRRIGVTLAAKGLGDLAAERLKDAARSRIVGFEIMTAPLIIAHWQVGQLLKEAGAPLAEDERAAIYLTNALTGWSHNAPQPAIQGFDELLKERTEANAVKRTRRILVVIGNPPYNAFAGVDPAGDDAAVAGYKAGLREIWGVKKFNLDDLFVRFFRVAEQRIAQATGEGIVCFITNYSWLSMPSFTVMRQSLIESFDRGWFENMHGDRQITEYGPDGRTSETVFAIPGMSVGIRQGVAINLLLRSGRSTQRRYLFRDDIDASVAAERRADLLATLTKTGAAFDADYAPLSPSAENRFLLRPGQASNLYASWVPLPDLSRITDWSGLLEKRKGSLIADDRTELEARIRRYADPRLTFEQVAREGVGPVEEASRFDPRKARALLLKNGGFAAGTFRRLALLPFDHRWCFHTDLRPLWNEPRPNLAAQQALAIRFLVARSGFRRDVVGYPAYATGALPGDFLLDPNVHPMPFSIFRREPGLFGNVEATEEPNLSGPAIAWLAKLDLPATPDTSRQVWHHALATTYSPAWLAENAEAIRQGWPRIPLPGAADLLAASAALGEQVAALLDPDTNVPGVTSGAVRPELAAIAVPSTTPGTKRDWTLACWGHRTEKGVTMPGRGRADPRRYTEAEAATGAQSPLLGGETLDVWMNGASFWRNIPETVWETHIGGYQVIKKWLSYRDGSILGRPLSEAEVAHVQATARRLAALRLMGPDLDASFRACAAAHKPLPG